MKRFLYQPVLDAIDAREKRIATELADAAQKQAQADTEREAFKKKNTDFDQQREALVRKAHDEVDAERKRMLTDARAEADALQVKQREALEAEMHSLQQDIAQRSRDEVLAIARKVLTDLAGASLEEQMVQVFCQRLQTLDAPAKVELAKTLKASTDTVRVRSAFALSPAQQAAIGQALDAAMETQLPLAFETNAAVIGGIELSANGWKLPWNIAEFLAALEHSAPVTP